MQTKPPQKHNEHAAFVSALKKVLSVSHADMKAKLDAEKQAKKRRRKRTSGHASGEKD
jgi:hypothetical protein